MAQQLLMLFAWLLVGAGLITGFMAYLVYLRDPMRETNKQERADARALRKENPMTVRDRLAAAELAWKKHVQRRTSRYEGRHRRPEGTSATYHLRYALAYRDLIS